MADEILYASEAIVCNGWFEDNSEDPDDEGLMVECRQVSRFQVSRSDGDQSYGTGGGAEACEDHLTDAVLGMVDGDEQVRAVVTVRWDKPVQPECTDPSPF